MSEPAERIFAREIIFNLIQQQMNEVNAVNYVSGGNSGGIANLALIDSEAVSYTHLDVYKRQEGK